MVLASARFDGNALCWAVDAMPLGAWPAAEGRAHGYQFLGEGKGGTGVCSSLSCARPAVPSSSSSCACVSAVLARLTPGACSAYSSHMPLPDLLAGAPTPSKWVTLHTGGADGTDMEPPSSCPPCSAFRLRLMGAASAPGATVSGHVQLKVSAGRVFQFGAALAVCPEKQRHVCSQQAAQRT